MTALALMPQAVPCAHCGAACEASAGERVYCCTGCEAAAAILSEAGLDDYYERLTAPAPRPEGAGPRSWAGLPVATLADGSQLVRLRIDGLRCSACGWVSEQLLERQPGVQRARVSFATGQAEVVFSSEQTDLDAILEPVAALGYRPTAPSAPVVADRDLLRRLGVASFCAANAMMIAVAVYLGWATGMDPRFSALFRWSLLGLASPAALWAAAPFFRSARESLRNRAVSMDVPISLAIALMYGHGFVATFSGQDSYLDSLTMLVALLLGGRVLESRGRARAAEAATALSTRAPGVGRVERQGAVEVIASPELVVGDVLLLGAGEEIAADGVVLTGQGLVDLSLVTGESEPEDVGPGDHVVAGGVVHDGALRVSISHVGEQTVIGRMARQLAEAVPRVSAPDRLSRLAPWFTGTTLLVAGLCFAAWTALDGVDAGVRVTVAVLVVACPCALSLAGPLAMASGLGAAARRGLLVREPGTLERLAEVDAVAVDKTGTATGGQPVVVSATDATLRLAAAVERYSTHPLGRAIVSEAVRRGIPLPVATAVVERPGVGIVGVVDGTRVEVRAGDAPATVEVVGVGSITLRDALRPDSSIQLQRLAREVGPVTLLTGDKEAVARDIAAQAGVDRVRASQTPDDKRRWLAESDHHVLFVGDGLNDGPALAAAHVGVAMGGGAASSVLAADAVVAVDSLSAVLGGVRAARAARRAASLGVHRSIIYNVVSVGLAAVGLVDPLVAAVLMPLSSALALAGARSVEVRIRRAEARDLLELAP